MPGLAGVDFCLSASTLDREGSAFGEADAIFPGTFSFSLMDLRDTNAGTAVAAVAVAADGFCSGCVG